MRVCALQPTLDALYLYDTAYMYALLAEQTLTGGLDLRNGTNLLQLSRGYSFTGLTHSLIHSLTHSFTYSLNQSLTHTHSLTQ